MKYVSLLCFCLILLISFTACGNRNALEKAYSLAPYKPETAGKATEPTICNQEKPPDSFITEPCDIHAVVERYCLRDAFGIGTLADVAAHFGVECLRETDAGALYSVHKVKQGGLLYIFYTNFPEHNNNVGNIIRLFYVQKSLSLHDFDGIREGMTIRDVAKIDPTAQIFENIYNANAGYWDKTGGFGSLHYLTDGILEVDYKNVKGRLTVARKIFTDDFQLPQNSGVSYPYDGRILPIDRIQ